jgi:hypothetical protein
MKKPTESSPEVRELRQATVILRKASAYFAPGGARPPLQAMKSFYRRSPRGLRGRADLQSIANRPVERLMRRLGLRGVMRGKTLRT